MIKSNYGIENHGLKPTRTVHWNNSVPDLIEQAIKREEGQLTQSGALATLTGKRTGRSPRDKFIVKDSTTEGTIAWGKVNQPITADIFDRLHEKTIKHLNEQELFVVDAWAGADNQYGLPIRLITTKAWHALFARQLFRRPTKEEMIDSKPQFLILGAPDCHADPAVDGTNSEAYVVADFARKTILIGGTHYAGEIKKSIFTTMNYLLPEKNVFPMHCSANIGQNDDVALFFGLSGTGKTTLSADPDRRLIGDDEHGWSDHGVFNFEGGCYAKCIRLSEGREPEIYHALKFGSVLENVVVDPVTRVTDFDDDKFTENTRAAYPVEYIDNAILTGYANSHPVAVIFLTCDAFGVLPPISRLTPEQAMYHFLSGYTAKLAGTEAGVGSEPQATFSTGFGQPFLPRDPMVYAKLLSERIKKHDSSCFFINTGWCGGPFGIGNRIDLAATRTMISEALKGNLRGVETVEDPIFGLHIPHKVPGVSPELLIPKQTWADRDAYDTKAKELAALFNKNFQKFASATPDVKAAGPRVG
ncbi:MAG: phosphoenolpyruvate carboxykinase (ATP) [Phycisphaerales bacterium]|nr:phosphoenolpyruvate carboxykinase (ATP) [Phycisphaerales bacterium]